MIRRNILTIVVFILSCSVCVLLSFFAADSCEEILNYSWTVQFGVGGVVISMLRMFIIWIAGVTVWLLIRRKIQVHRYKRIKYFYFALLPLVIFSKQLLEIPSDIMNRPLKRSICYKTISTGIRTDGTNLTLAEHNYLRIHFQLLPALPLTAEKINISYYTDKFSGDYSLSVHFECGMREPVDTTDHAWSVHSIDGSADKKEVTYEIAAH